MFYDKNSTKKPINSNDRIFKILNHLDSIKNTRSCNNCIYMNNCSNPLDIEDILSNNQFNLLYT